MGVERRPVKIPPPVACDRCSRPISPGAPRYVLTLRLTSDFDGYIPEPEPGESPFDALAACEALDEDEALASVDLRLAYTICPQCRAVVVANPLQRPDAAGETGGALH